MEYLVFGLAMGILMTTGWLLGAGIDALISRYWPSFVDDGREIGPWAEWGSELEADWTAELRSLGCSEPEIRWILGR